MSVLVQRCHDEWMRQAELAWPLVCAGDRHAEEYYNRRHRACRYLRMRAAG